MLILLEQLLLGLHEPLQLGMGGSVINESIFNNMLGIVGELSNQPYPLISYRLRK